MAKGQLREIVDLGNLSAEDKAKLNINTTKSAKAGTGFAQAIRVQDSVAARSANPSVEPVVEPESPEEVQPAEPVTQSTENPTEVEPTAPAIDVEVLAGLVQQAVEQNVAPLQQQLSAQEIANQELREKLANTETALNTAQESAKAVDNLALLLGRAATPQAGGPAPAPQQMPSVNTQSTIGGGDGLTGMLREFSQERVTDGLKFRRTKNGANVPVFDPRRSDRFAIQNGWHDPSSAGFQTLMNELTDYGKSMGLFTGGGLMDASRSATTASDLPPAFLETMSSMMRVSNRPGLIFHQFTKVVHRFDRGMGDKIDIYRAAYPETLTNSNERLLSGPQTYVPIDSSNTNINTGFVQLVLNEYGRGQTNAPPIAIPTFVEAFSMIELYTILVRNLFWDYYHFEDLIIREQWKPTTAVYYPDGPDGTIVTAANQVNTGGTCNRKFLRKLYTRLHEQQWIPLPDQCYGIVMVPTQLEQLKESLADEWEPPTQSDVAALTNMMAFQYPNSENIQISGYQGKYENFHIWSTNAFGVDHSVNTTTDYDVAGSEGSAVEVSGTTNPARFLQGYVFGSETIGCGIGGAGAQILYDEKTDFGRIQRAIWHSYEAHGPLDVDPVGYGDTSNVPQQLRVGKFRTATEAVA